MAKKSKPTKKTQSTKIEFNIELDENKIPEGIEWIAEDGDKVSQKTKALLISLWDPEKKETLRIDLWTKDMPLDEMQHFFYQTLLSLSETYERATNDTNLAESMKDFCVYFSEQLGITPQQPEPPQEPEKK